MGSLSLPTDTLNRYIESYTTMTRLAERRHHTRYPAGHLRVLAKSLRDKDADWIMGFISTVDFNRFGIGLETKHNFVIGDILAMVIRTDDATLTEINGLICNRTQIERGYRFGIRFEQDSDSQEDSPEAMININEEILMIERDAAAAIH
jgi:hypothetical protein